MSNECVNRTRGDTWWLFPEVLARAPVTLLLGLRKGVRVTMKRYLIGSLIFLASVGSGYCTDSIGGSIMFGMRAKEAAETLADGSRAVLDPSFEPKGVAEVIQSKGMRLEFLHDRLYSITYDTKFDLSVPSSPFSEKHYNLPAHVWKTIRWGMTFSEFQKVLDTWSEELAKSGMILVRRSDKYVEQADSKALGDRQFTMEMLHPARHEYWVHFGPPAENSLPRVLWSFQFDPEYNTLMEIGIRDRSMEGLVLIKTK
jgi:hypothetical protein